MSRVIKLGLFGFGVVGQGLYDVLNKAKAIQADVYKICVKDRNKRRTIPDFHFTFDPDDILKNPEVDVVVEIINDAEEAYKICTEALKNGKHVVTANKKMLAEHLEELVALQQKHNVSLLYEASTCGAIPIIRNLEEYYDNELLYTVSGIFNGTSNFILTKIFNDNLTYDVALRQAQDLGFAETDPTSDVGGFDAKYKLVIIAAHAYGLFVNPEKVFNYGIQHLSKYDVQYAKEKGYKIKLVPTAQKFNDKQVTLFVMPQFVSKEHYLYDVDYENNGVIVEAAFADKQFFFGKGAGGHPTGSAVLSDISALTYNYKYEYKKYLQGDKIQYTTEIEIEVYVKYIDEKDIKSLKFIHISERFFGKEHNYVIGTINLSDLIKAKDLLANKNVFVVNTGNQISLSKKEKEAAIAKKHVFEAVLN
ncbi:MAG: homoserine dehydrogenase [Bacteroidota bacterium]|nr:homoserine dehydrogenase [Bacteroidota bacterium]